MTTKDDATDATDDVLDDILTDEERAALEESDEGEEGKAEDPEATKEDEEGAGGVEGETEESTESAEKGSEEGEAAEEETAEEEEVPEKDTSEKQEEDEKDGGQFAAEYEVAAPEDSAGKLKALKKQYDEGDIELDEYLDARDELNKAEIEAKIRTDLTEANKQHRWQEDQRAFFEDNPEFTDNPVMQGALQGALDSIWSDKAHAHKSGAAKLKVAAKTVRESLGLNKASEDSATKSEKTDDKADKNAKREALKGRGKTPEVKTLANVPAAEDSDLGGDSKFTHLEKLEGIELERAILKMPEDEQEAYLLDGTLS